MLLLLPLPRVQAATITVDSDCSLANAVRSANGTAQTGERNRCESGDTGADTISLGRNVTLGAALPDITSTITINGNGRFISGADTYRIFNITASGNLTLDNVTLRNAAGNAIVVAEGGDLTVQDSLFHSNQGVSGGAISSQGSISISNSRFRDNHTTNEGGAINVRGGFASLTVTGSIFENNSTGLDGGAILTRIAATLRNSSFVGNRAGRDGGAFIVTGLSPTLENVTFHGNRASSRGGGVFTPANRSVQLRHATFTGNRAASGGGIYFSSVGTSSLVNTVIAGSSGGDCAIGSGSLSASQMINSWIQDGSCSATFSGNPQLAPPRGNPPVAPPYIGSGLVDAAPDDSNCLDTDIRGVERPVGDACDIGAYEGAVSRPPAESSSSGRYIRPTPVRETCETRLPAGVSVSRVYDGMQCQQVDAGGIGNRQVIQAGYRAAVDIWGWVGGAGLEVCLQGQGKLVFLDAAFAPRKLLSLKSATENGRTCAFIDRVGTVVLLPGDSKLNPPAATMAARSEASSRSLSDCMVTATDTLNLRAGPGGRVIGYVLTRWRLTALARTAAWFKVDNDGVHGWISADYVTLAGDCG